MLIISCVLAIRNLLLPDNNCILGIFCRRPLCIKGYVLSELFAPCKLITNNLAIAFTMLLVPSAKYISSSGWRSRCYGYLIFKYRYRTCEGCSTVVITVVFNECDPVSFHYYRIYCAVLSCINYRIKSCATFCYCPSSVCVVSIFRSYMYITGFDICRLVAFNDFLFNLSYFFVNADECQVECCFNLSVALDGLFFCDTGLRNKFYSSISIFIEPSLEFLIFIQVRNSGVYKLFAFFDGLP